MARSDGCDLDVRSRSPTELLACEDERRDRPPFTDEWPASTSRPATRSRTAPCGAGSPAASGWSASSSASPAAPSSSGWASTSPFVAWLTDAMVLPAGEPVPQDRLIHPRIEPEIVFVMGDRLEGPGRHGRRRRWRRSRSVYGGAEVIDSRYRGLPVPRR